MRLCEQIPSGVRQCFLLAGDTNPQRLQRTGEPWRSLQKTERTVTSTSKIVDIYAWTCGDVCADFYHQSGLCFKHAYCKLFKLFNMFKTGQEFQRFDLALRAVGSGSLMTP